MMKKMLYYTSDVNNTDEMKDEGKESEKRISLAVLDLIRLTRPAV